MSESAATALVLLRRQQHQPPGPGPFLRLALSAEERSRLRGHRLSRCGRDLVLQLERGDPLRPGEWLLGGAEDPPVLVEAAPEALLQVSCDDPLALLQAAYHLGNRHVALQIGPAQLRLQADPVLADLLERRGLAVQALEAPFLPEPGAYAGGHDHHQGSGHHHLPHPLPQPQHGHAHGADSGLPG
jgi:urease accessory protein